MKSQAKIKAELARKKAAKLEKRHQEQLEAVTGLKVELKALHELINGQKPFDGAGLVEQIESLKSTLNLKEQFENMVNAIGDNKPKEAKLDLSAVVKAIEKNKPVVNVDLSEIKKAIIEVRQRVQDQSVIEQAPEEYQPVRRVVKVGNRLIFDDNPTSSSRGGGGSSLPLVSGSVPVVNPDGSNIGGSTTLPSSFAAFRTTVTTAGTRVQLTSNALTVGVILEAPSTNTGLIYIGGSNVSSSVFGAELQAGQSVSMAVNNTNLIYADASVSGDKVAALGS